MGLLLHGSYLAWQEERLSLAGDSDSHPTSPLQPPCLAPSSRHSTALLEKEQREGPYGWAGQCHPDFWLKT